MKLMRKYVQIWNFREALQKQIDSASQTKKRDYQLDFCIPEIDPCKANSRKTIRDMRNFLYTERERPVTTQRFLIRVFELFLGSDANFNENKERKEDGRFLS